MKSRLITLETTIEHLPQPFHLETFNLIQEGIFDSKDTSVFLNESKDFAFLFPTPRVDYVSYVPRVKSLGLANYKRTTAHTIRRFDKIKPYFSNEQKVLEIGSGTGEFLGHISRIFPHTHIASLEIDQNTKPTREKISGLKSYASFTEMEAMQETFDLICMFHVLEHIINPKEFLTNCLGLLSPKGRLIIEVPSLHDPLLTLYDSLSYKQFYFQCQHPYVYSSGSLRRLLESENFHLEQLIFHQRYGLENHLNWLTQEKPGGNQQFRQMFNNCEANYMTALEKAGFTDSVIAIAKVSQ